MSYDLQFFYVWQNLDKLGQGLVVSLELTGLANLIGLTLGFGVALLLRAKSALLRAPAAAMVEVFSETSVESMMVPLRRMVHYGQAVCAPCSRLGSGPVGHLECPAGPPCEHPAIEPGNHRHSPPLAASLAGNGTTLPAGIRSRDSTARRLLASVECR